MRMHSKFQFEDIQKNSSQQVAEIVNNPSKMRAAQYLNMFGAKMHHEVLEDGKILETKRMSLMKTLVSVSQTFLERAL